MSEDRPTIEVAPVPGGWPAPWPSVAELAEALPAGSWTLVGGLMTQLHTIHYGQGIVRPTNDVDIVLHIETMRGVPDKVATALEALGYRFQPSIDARNNTAHRFVRGTTTVDLVAGAAEDQVDVLIADHLAPRVIEKLRGHEMIRIECGTQALRRTVNARLEIMAGTTATPLEEYVARDLEMRYGSASFISAVLEQLGAPTATGCTDRDRATVARMLEVAECLRDDLTVADPAV